MKERGMIFNGEMVRAILDGRKTQTRRPIKWKQTRFTEIGEREDGSNWPWSEDAEHACDFWHPCPFGAVGDRIWVRETWATLGNEDGCCVDWEGKLCKGDERSAARIYRASCEQRPGDYGLWSIPDDAYWKPHTKEHKFEGAWRPSIHMPRWASRILLEITNVRVERLQSITLGDICKEVGCGLYDFRPATYGFQVWEELWKSIYGAENWQANPWVWVISFERVEGGAA
ncbi:hypothetical protein AZZ74_003619 [Klebsiella pneumoniae]|uniref:hypothetical protein n=1 Tax=Klebsiella pneumoniae TaxID=573 RepID=UPI000A3904DB|nr:hypothetical protein [Klebsiella pneumoniae]OUI39108.1 hypothetical protein AZZ74_003619 [Klebsiella pneumoniae]HBV9972668.1 hypothetical protein [Klebsiella pneumoniae]HBZ1574174.1 hypothetical protein [Klebsiella pneumoniae]HCB0270753.1 hypothetical protein [Klebsiella pneumoniae]HCT5328746.1 hypothetical protein [Klebsiella pneumoniae]